jgi:ADP-ribose pyrophosphatase
MSLEILRRTTHLTVQGVSVETQQVRLPSQRTVEKLVVRHPGAVAIVPITEDGQVILIRQYRLAAERILWEIPAGTLEAGEDPRICAERELQEEAGFFPGELTLLGSFYVAPGISTEVIQLFIARDLRPSQLEKDDDELIEVVKIPLVDALEKIRTGEICDGKTIIGLLRIKQA